MRAGHERQRPVVVGPQFLGRAGLAGVVAGNRQAAAHFHVQVLEAGVVVALPAVQRDGNLGQLLQGTIRIHAHRGVPFLGQRIRRFDRFRLIWHAFLTC